MHEHQFTPLDIDQALKDLDLQFLGFVNLPFETKHGFDQLFSEDVTRTNLANWDQYEATYPNSFGNMFQFYCQHQEANVMSMTDQRNGPSS